MVQDALNQERAIRLTDTSASPGWQRSILIPIPVIGRGWGVRGPRVLLQEGGVGSSGPPSPAGRAGDSNRWWVRVRMNTWIPRPTSHLHLLICKMGTRASTLPGGLRNR